MRFYWVFVLLLFSLGQVWASRDGVKVLKAVTRNSIDKQGNKTAFYRYEFEVTSEAGRKELTDYKIIFYGDNENFRFTRAYSETAGRKIETNSIHFFSTKNSKTAHVAFPGIKVGSRVFIAYSIFSESPLAGQFSESITLDSDMAAIEESYLYQSEIPLRHLAFDAEAGQIREEFVNGKYNLEIRPAKTSTTAKFYLSTSPSWEALSVPLSAGYMKVLNEGIPSSLEDIATAARKLKTAKEQIEFSARGISKLISYAGDWRTNEARIFPQNLDVLLKSRRGDCKDYATALVAVLRKLNFTAYPALTFRTEQYSELERVQKISELPRLNSFSHAIVWARDGEKTEWWIDPTNPTVVADTIPVDLLGNFALVLNGHSQNVNFLPEKNHQGSDVVIDQTFKSGAVVTGQLLLNQAGLSADAVKDILKLLLTPVKDLQVNQSRQPASLNSDYRFTYNPSSEKAAAIPLLAFLERIRSGHGLYLGEIGTYKLVTHIESSEAGGDAGCAAHTPWLDVERVVEKRGSMTHITELLRTKKRVIRAGEASAPDFLKHVQALKLCALTK